MINAVPCADRSLTQITDAMQRAYERYVIPMNFTLENVQQRFRQDNVDLLSSWIFEADDRPAGVLIISRRGDQARVTAVGFHPELRGQGHGRAAMARAIREAKLRGDRTLLLETFRTNDAAVALYRRMGFQTVRELRGYLPPPSPRGALKSGFHELSPALAGRLIARFSDDDLPWQLQPETFAGATAPVRAFGLGASAVALVQQTSSAMRLLSLAVDPGQRRTGRGSALLDALQQNFPKERLEVTPILHDGGNAAFLKANGWQASAMDQFEMRLSL